MTYGTHSLKREEAGLSTNEGHRLPWAKEIECKINVFNEPVQHFFKVFVPGSGPSKQLSTKIMKDALKKVDFRGRPGDKYTALIGGLRNLVRDFEAKTKPAFAEGSRCRVPLPSEAWDEDYHYTTGMPNIVMSLPGSSDTEWAPAWPGISAVFEVKTNGSEDPVDEDSATIKTDALPTYGLIQIAKSARNLLHTHQLPYAYVVGIYGDKARIYCLDHTAGVVSKAIDFKKDPYPLYDFLWRFCHYEHGCQPTSEQQRTAEPGVFLGMDPTITATSEVDSNRFDELLQTSSPPQKCFTKDEKKACRWISVVTEYSPVGSAKFTKWYIMYRLRFPTPRLFSRATRVSDAYEAETWERRAIKDAWRPLARDPEEPLYNQLRDALRQREDLEKLVEECKNPGLSRDDSTTGDDDGTRSGGPPPSAAKDEESKDELNDEGKPTHAGDLATVSDSPLYELPDVEADGAREARKLVAIKSNNMGASSPSEADLDSLALGEADRPPGYDVYQRKICVWLLRDKSWEATKFNDRSHMRLVMRTVGRPLSSFKSTKEMVTAIRDAIIGHKLAFLAGLIHRDLSDGNVMIHDGGVFGSFSLDLVYAFDWMEALELAGRPADKEAWAVYVEEYDQSVVYLKRPGSTVDDILTLVAGSEMPSGDVMDQGASWIQRMKMQKRTGAMFFMAAQILRTFVAHDIRHDLESVVWLLLYMVLRHTLQVHVTTKKELDRNQLYLERFGATGELGSFEKKMMYLHDEAEWEVKDNKPLNKLIRDLWDLAYEQNASRGKSTPLTYESVLTAFNRALAFSKWPTNDTALPFTLLCDDNSAQSS